MKQRNKPIFLRNLTWGSIHSYDPNLSIDLSQEDASRAIFKSKAYLDPSIMEDTHIVLGIHEFVIDKNGAQAISRLDPIIALPLVGGGNRLISSQTILDALSTGCEFDQK